MSKELGTLVIVVLKAQNLMDKNSFSKQDPYAKLILNGATKQTPVDPKGGQHPSWDAELRFPILRDPSKSNRTLTISVFSEKRMKEDELLGEGSVDITDTLKSGEFDDWVPLSLKGAQRGEVYLELTFFAAGPARPVPLTRRPSKLISPTEPLTRPQQPVAQRSQRVVPSSGVAHGNVYDTIGALRMHMNKLLNLSHRCRTLLSTLREYSPSFVGILVGTGEADEIEGAIERTLRRISGWEKLTDRATFLRRNEVLTGIGECYREFTTRAEGLTIVLSMMNNSDQQPQEFARHYHPKQIIDMLTLFLNELRSYERFATSEGPQLAELRTPVKDIDEQQGAPLVVSRPRSKSPDLSTKVSRADEHVVIKGNLLDFYLGEWTNDGDYIALGRLKDQSLASQMRFKEWVEVLSGLQHRNILSLFGHAVIEGVVYSVCSWMENGSLREYIRGNLDADRMRLLSQVASGVEFLHEEGIIHGDLCDGNILINGDGRAFVCGFGMSEFSNAASELIRARWLAPERVTFASVTPPTLETDVWSFGLLCLEVFTGENPYNSYSDVFVPVLLSRGTTPEHPGSTAVGLSPRIWELMQSCWAIDPTERPSMSTIQSTIRDMLPPRFSRQQYAGNKDLTFPNPFPPIVDSALQNEASHQSEGGSSLVAPLSLSAAQWGAFYPEAQSDSIRVPHPSGTMDRPANTQAPTFISNRASEASSWSFNPLPTLTEHPLNPDVLGTPLSIPSSPLSRLDLRPRLSVSSSTSRSTTHTNESGPRQRWPRGSRPNPKVFSNENDDLSPLDSETVDPKGGKTDITEVNDMLELI